MQVNEKVGASNTNGEAVLQTICTRCSILFITQFHNVTLLQLCGAYRANRLHLMNM